MQWDMASCTNQLAAIGAREEYGGGSTLLKDFFYLLKVTIIFIPNT